MGERPSADKFNAVNKYFSRGMVELAGAIGDIHDKGWPYHTLDGVGKGIGAPWNLTGAGNKARDLDIVNLARLIGPASNLNARMFTNIELDTKSIQEQIPVGVFEFETSYPMRELPTVTGLTPTGSEFTNAAQFTMSGNKKIRFSSATTENMIATYDTRPSSYHGGADYQFAGFNVIPDPNQSTGLTITGTQNPREYLIDFPTIQAQQSGLVNLNDSTFGTAAEFNNAKQYAFPKWLNDIMLSAESKKIPHNYIYLKNRITREIFKDAEYTWESASSLLVSNVDICEENGAIPGADYCIITVGANITNYIDDIRLKLFKHDHSGMFGEPLVSIKHLADKYEFEPPSGIYGPSGLPWNQLPMYLHRDGYVTDSNGNNGNNAMRGDLMMGLISFDPLGTDLIANGVSNSSSHQILFGDDRCRIQNFLGSLVIANHIPNEGDIVMESGDKFTRSATTEILDTAPIINITGSDQLNFRGERIKILGGGITISGDGTFPFEWLRIDSHKLFRDMNTTPGLSAWNLLSTIYGEDATELKFPEVSGKKETNLGVATSLLLSRAVFNFSFKEGWQVDFTTHWDGLGPSFTSGPFEITGANHDSAVQWSGYGTSGDPNNNSDNSIPSVLTEFLEDNCVYGSSASKIEKLLIYKDPAGGSNLAGKWLMDVSHPDMNCIYDFSFGDYQKTDTKEFAGTTFTDHEYYIHPLFNSDIAYGAWRYSHLGIVINRFKNYFNTIENLSTEEIRSTYYIKINLGLARLGHNYNNMIILIDFNYNGKLNANNEYISVLTDEGRSNLWAPHSIYANRTSGYLEDPLMPGVSTDSNDNNMYCPVRGIKVDCLELSDPAKGTLEVIQGNRLKITPLVDEIYLKVNELFIDRQIFLTIEAFGPLSPSLLAQSFGINGAQTFTQTMDQS